MFCSAFSRICDTSLVENVAMSLFKQTSVFLYKQTQVKHSINWEMVVKPPQKYNFRQNLNY